MPPFSGALTRKQQWLHLGRKSKPPPPPPSSSRRVALQRKAVDVERPNLRAAAADFLDVPRIITGDPLFGRPDVDRSHRCCSRPLWGTTRSCSRPRYEPGLTRCEDENARTLEAARTRAHRGMGQGSSTAPPSADRREARREALKQARTVRFDPCVRVVLVPSRRDIDKATKHAVWWGRADVRQFRRNAYHFFQEHGTLSVVSNEELRQAGPPPGMPPPPFLRADSGSVAGDGAALPKDPSTRRRRHHHRRASGTTGRHTAPGPGSAGEPQREDLKGCKAVSEPRPGDTAAGEEVAKGVQEAQKAGRRQVYCEHEARFTTVAFVVM